MLGGKEVSNEVLDLLDQPLPVYADAPPQTLMPFQRSITLSDLTFQYDKNAPWVLRDSLNLSIQKGSRIGFIGATGSGKKHIARYYYGSFTAYWAVA